MEYITRQQLDLIVKDPSLITEDELVSGLERLGYSVFLEKRLELTEKQKKQMTKAIFTNKEVLGQLRESSSFTEDDYIFDEEESSRLIREAGDDR